MGQCWAPGASRWGHRAPSGIGGGCQPTGWGKMGRGGNQPAAGKESPTSPPLAFVVGAGEVDPGWAPIGRLQGFERQVGRQAGALGRARPGHLSVGICPAWLL